MFSPAQNQRAMRALRCTAERDPDDRIANAASQLAHEMEVITRSGRLTDVDRQLIRYALAKNYAPLRADA